MFLDASPLLALFLATERAAEAEALLAGIEAGRARAVTTLHVLEEVGFKLVVAQASGLLNDKNVWKIRAALKKDRRLREQCAHILGEFTGYVSVLQRGGLTLVPAEMTDLQRLPELVQQAGLLTADALHLAVMKRLKISRIVTFDADFGGLNGIVVVP